MLAPVAKRPLVGHIGNVLQCEAGAFGLRPKLKLQEMP